MARKKLGETWSPEKVADDAAIKYSLLVPGVIHNRVLEIAEKEDKTVSQTVRLLLERVTGSAAEGEITIKPSATVRAGLQEIADIYATSVEDITNQVLTRGLREAVIEARELEARLKDLAANKSKKSK